MKVTLVNPPMVYVKNDYSGSGIVYVPIMVGHVSSFLKSEGHDVQVIDAFSSGIKKRRVLKNDLEVQGLNDREILERVRDDSDLICIYASNVMNHSFVLNLIRRIKENLNCKILVFENSFYVTGYSLLEVVEDFITAGSDFIVLGDPERRIKRVLEDLSNLSELKNVNGLIINSEEKIINPVKKVDERLDSLPFPDYDAINIEKYWSLGYAHGPLTSSKYIPIMSSRGCPFNCSFCVSPATNKSKWRSRSAENIVKEMEAWVEKGVTEFHFEDLNPTINKKRIQKMCDLIIKKNLNIDFKFASGVKIETLDEETLEFLAEAGCSFISFSPESGSKRVLNLMSKPFNHEKALKLVKKASRLGMITQACFVIGFPGEEMEDLMKTKEYIMKLERKSLSEIAVFILAPMPGSKIFKKFKIEDLSKISFSSQWRKDFKELNSFRRELYLSFFAKKFLLNPLKLFSFAIHVLTRNFKTKSEMAVFKAIITNL